MELNIEFEALDPPQGWTHEAASIDRLRFDGWLGLIRTIEALVDSAAGIASTHPSITSFPASDGIGPSGRGEEQG